MKDIILPEPMKDVMVTFMGDVRVRDKYYDHYEKQEITKTQKP